MLQKINEIQERIASNELNIIPCLKETLLKCEQAKEKFNKAVESENKKIKSFKTFQSTLSPKKWYLFK